MPADKFLDETDRVWDELKPLYDALHCHVRDQLSNYYGEEVVPNTGNLPAHILGNMWGQSWSNIYDLVYTPEISSSSSEINLTNILIEKDIDEIEMVNRRKLFYFMDLSSIRHFLGRSLFTKPQDRNVVCHASAWDLNSDINDLKSKCVLRGMQRTFQ